MSWVPSGPRTGVEEGRGRSWFGGTDHPCFPSHPCYTWDTERTVEDFSSPNFGTCSGYCNSPGRPSFYSSFRSSDPSRSDLSHWFSGTSASGWSTHPVLEVLLWFTVRGSGKDPYEGGSSVPPSFSSTEAQGTRPQFRSERM